MRTRAKEFQHDSAGIELGYRYENSPICVGDGTPAPELDHGLYVPSTRPGWTYDTEAARLPRCRARGARRQVGSHRRVYATRKAHHDALKPAMLHFIRMNAMSHCSTSVGPLPSG
jgi:hypothetical protein